MKKILCFGDSNIYGFIPANGKRYDVKTRWSGILKSKLKDCDVIEAGMNGRTCFSFVPDDELCGIKIIEKYLALNPSIIILAIGLNDLQSQYRMTEEKFEKGLKCFLNLVRKNYPTVQVLLLSPSSLNDGLLNTFFASLFDKNSIELSKNLSSIYQRVAKEVTCDFIDLNKIAQASLKDGLHYEIDAHQKIAEEVLAYLE